MACFPSGSLSLLCSQALPALTLPWVMQETWVVWSESVSSPLGCSSSIMGSSAEAAAPSGETHLLCWGLSRRRDLLLSLLLLSPRGLQGHFSLFFPSPLPAQGWGSQLCLSLPLLTDTFAAPTSTYFDQNCFKNLGLVYEHDHMNIYIGWKYIIGSKFQKMQTIQLVIVEKLDCFQHPKCSKCSSGFTQVLVQKTHMQKATLATPVGQAPEISL